MESYSWSYISDEKGLVPDTAVNSPSNLISRSAFMNWEPKAFGHHHLFVSGQPPLDMVHSFGELGVPQHPPPPPESNSSAVDLKLGRFGDLGNRNSVQEQLINHCSSESSAPAAKRVRGSTMNPPTAAYCQVYGCNKDLSSCKDYHKRHRVCDVHSKTATVVVNGIQQRFCQQCSRFHLLADFDEGKRSCRKRLAGHNQRRRKLPHLVKSGRLLQSYAGNGVRGNALVSTSSFICPDILPSGGDLLNPEKYAETDAYELVKVEDPTTMSTQHHPLYAVPIPIDHIHSKTPISGYTLFDKHFLFYKESSSSASSSSIHGLSGISEPGRALSLLSSQSQNSSTHSSGFPPEPSVEENHHHRQIPISECNDSMKSFEGSERIHGKEDGAMINLSQLSSRLHRVETKRQSL